MPGHYTEDRWIDVFVTKPDRAFDQHAYDFDDHFVCSVQSVRCDPLVLNRAAISSSATDWVMPTWTTDYETESPDRIKMFTDIKVGDLIRIGTPQSTGYTDYLTVLEVREIDKLFNATDSDIIIDMSGDESLSQTEFNEDTSGIDTSDARTIAKTGFAHFALRLNSTIACTKLPSSTTQDAFAMMGDPVNLAQTEEDDTLDTTITATLASRHLATTSSGNTTYDDEKKYYPMYAMNNWLSQTTLRAHLDHGVKQVRRVKLVGYSLANKRQVGIHSAHEMIDDDYINLRIREVPGRVISNNRHANGAFAILFCGSSNDNQMGAIEYNRFDYDGITVQDVDAGNSVIRDLTFELTDRHGKAAHFGRMHLWFKLLVTHG